MTFEERQRIVSEEYADLLISYSGDLSVFEDFEDATVHIVNFFYAVVHVPVEQITENIILERGYSVMPSLLGIISEASLEESGIIRLRNIPNFDLRGQGVLVGILDTGIDYTNPIFQYADNTTRIVSIWDQTIESENPPEGLYYGTEFFAEQINEALQSENPLEIVPSMDEIGHGTMLAGIAAGNEVPESDFTGVVPDAEIVVVKLKPAKQYLKRFFRIPEEAVAYQENDILFAIEYIRNVAFRLNRPIAICIALGTSQGAHDGRGILSGFLSLRAEVPGVGIVVAAGNEGNDRRHYFGEIDESIGYDTVELNIGENEEGFSMELWGNSPGIFSIDITTPSGEYVPRIAARLDENREVSFIFERTIIYVDYQMIESQSGNQLILLRFSKPDPGIWRFNVYGRGDIDPSFHIWLPMGNFISGDTYFIRSNPYTTILSLGNAIVPITTTAYNIADDSLYQDASRGYTRTEIIKPDIAAPGVDILAPTLEQGFAPVTGTSVSAAHTTGVAAMLLEWGIVRGAYPRMSTVDLRMFMIRGARRNMDIRYPNRDWGYGILDVFNIFERIRSELPPL
ncbi:S8 family peptidase [Mobilitalea sibirica]|uniref:S8 family peptidase n=1 Tax=Mobilitalea sibirica TaxID=1462919 RepID=A0A8J7GYD2_9FIRM|nr:S8 family peptidase [Mobilitalea sibirica]MBH1940449.1 S8 family peptidase [Mobilitalea sibirica]